MIIHTSGEWIKSSYEMKPTKNDPQGLGSAITYQRRYALGAVLSLNIDDDDDGNKASEKQKTPPPVVDDREIFTPSHEKWDGAAKAVKENTTTLEKVKQFYKMTPVDEKKFIELTK